MGDGHEIRIDCSRCTDMLRCVRDGCQYLASLEPPPPKAQLRHGWWCPGCGVVHCPSTNVCLCQQPPPDERTIAAASLGDLMRMARGVTEADLPTRKNEK